MNALLSHPNDTLRIGLGLGLTGISIGLAGLGLALVIYTVDIVRSGGDKSTWIAGFVVVVVLGALALWSLRLGLAATLGNPGRVRGS